MEGQVLEEAFVGVSLSTPCRIPLDTWRWRVLVPVQAVRMFSTSPAPPFRLAQWMRRAETDRHTIQPRSSRARAPEASAARRRTLSRPLRSLPVIVPSTPITVAGDIVLHLPLPMQLPSKLSHCLVRRNATRWLVREVTLDTSRIFARFCAHVSSTFLKNLIISESAGRGIGRQRLARDRVSFHRYSVLRSKRSRRCGAASR